ncbi:MAG: heavy-metal-associated domain-containing protein [Desulfovibrionales bacterium]
MKTLSVQGMSCQHCVNAVKKALENVDGVTDVSVDLEKGEASYETTREVDEATVKEAVRKAGYQVS